MGRFGFVVAFSAVVFLACGCGGKKEAPKTPLRDAPSEQKLGSAKSIAEASNAFGLKLADTLLKAQPDRSNLLISPISLHLCSALLLEGSKGPERDEFKEALGLGALKDEDLGKRFQTLTDALLSDPERPLSLANAVFIARPGAIRKDLSDRIDKRYAGRIFLSNDPASATREINAWADKNTHGRIPKILDQTDPALVVAFLNAVAFDARWEHEFEESKTSNQPFTTLGGTRVSVPMMHGEVPGFEAQTDDYAGVRLNYKSKVFSLAAFLPREGHSPVELLSKFQALGFGTILKALYDSEVVVSLPKFRFSDSHSFETALRTLGILKAFNRLDLSPIAPDMADGLFLSRALQKTRIDVDEKGTRAEAVTAEATKTAESPMSLVFNRPFLYVIVHNKTGAILFLGICGDPSKFE